MVRKIVILSIVAVLAGISGAQAAPMTADEVIAKNIEARGGADKIAAMKSVRIFAKGSGPGGGDVPITIEWMRPDNVRQEIDIQGQVIVQAYDGTTAWMVMPFTGSTDPQEMPEEASQQIREQADFEGVLVNYKDKGHSVELVGEEEIEGTPAYKLKVTKKNGDVDHYYLDTDAFLEFRATFRREINGQPVDIEVTFGDYKEIGGLVMPYSLEYKVPGAPAAQVLTIDKIEINPELSLDRFAMPAPAAAAAEG